MSNISRLTDKQRQIYRFIRTTIERQGYAPAIRDIGDEFAIKSPNGVMCHLKALEKKGLIRRDDKRARAIQLTNAMRSSPPSEGLPYLGTVAAGTPIEAIETAERLNLNELFANPEHFILKVRGDSMIEDHIEDGDFVVIRRENEPAIGQTVVALIEGDATLKRFHRKRDLIELRPANSTMEPILVTPEQDIKILGVLIGVLRQCAR